MAEPEQPTKTDSGSRVTLSDPPTGNQILLQSVEDLVAELNTCISDPRRHYFNFWDYPFEIARAEYESYESGESNFAADAVRLRAEFEALKTLITARLSE